MRRYATLITLAFLAASCAEPTTGPLYTPEDPPPTGLAVSLDIESQPTSATPALTIAASGDSVIASAVLNASGCSNFRVVAGQIGETLVITVLESFSDRICILISPPARFRTVVRPAPRGEYHVEYRRRVVPPQQPPGERIVGRQFVRLP